MNKIISKLELPILILVMISAFTVRLYKIDNPIADWHSWRQTDTSAVTRNFDKFGFDLLHPRFDDLSNIPSGKDNPEGYRFVEFPIYNSETYFLYKNFNQFNFSIEKWGRLVSILSSLFSIYFIYYIVKFLINGKAALFSAFFAAFLPFSIYYSRVILPEPSLIMYSLGMLYFIIKAIQSRDRRFEMTTKTYMFILLSSFFGAVALLIKPTAVFFFIPASYLWIKNFRFSKKSIFSAVLFALIVVLPFVFWRDWISQFPEGIPAWKWLLNSDNIRFKGAFFYWLFAERLGKLILGYWGVVFLVLGILETKNKQNIWFFRWWGISMFLYVSILATGNVKHDYYQAVAIPIIAIFLAKGLDFLLEKTTTNISRVGSYLILPIVIIFSLSFSWYYIRTYYWVNKPEIVEAGKAVDQLVPENAKVIAPYGGDTAFLYQTNRQGWPIGFEIEDKMQKGANYYVTVDPSDFEAQELMQKYELLKLTNQYAIIKLQ